MTERAEPTNAERITTAKRLEALYGGIALGGGFVALVDLQENGFDISAPAQQAGTASIVLSSLFALLMHGAHRQMARQTTPDQPPTAG